MPATPEKIVESISYINVGDGKNHPIDVETLDGKSASDFQEKMLVTSLDANSDDQHYPSAKCLYEIIYGISSSGGGSTTPYTTYK